MALCLRILIAEEQTAVEEESGVLTVGTWKERAKWSEYFMFILCVQMQ